MSLRESSIFMCLAALAAWDDAIVTGPVPMQGIASDPAETLARTPASPRDVRQTRCRTLDDRDSFSPPDTIEGWRARAELVRRRVLVAAGLWPLPERTPLAPVIHGRIDRGDYTVEKVSLESSPGFLVTGNLYRPAGRGDGPHAAVLSPHGHFANGRFCERSDAEVERQLAAGWETRSEAARYHIQARCVQLARMGCVVFHYDMVGYADSRQLGHGAGFGDAISELWARNAFGVQTWNSIRALDFLAGLPDVDPARIGVTGASGGGTQTFILCAIDERPAAAFPAVMVSTGMQGGCVCENASHLRVGTNNVEFAALFAPKPLALTGADDWTIEIETDGYPALKELYRMLGKPENVFAKCFPTFEHNYNEHSRALMYSWFNRHLALGQPEPIRERPFAPLTAAELSVFDEDHPRPEPFADLTAAMFDAPPLPDDPDEYARVVGGALSTLIASDLPGKGQVHVVEVSTTEMTSPRAMMRDVVLSRTGTEERVPALLFVPEHWEGGIVVDVPAGGRAAYLARLEDPLSRHEDLLLSRYAVLVPDVLLAGVEDARLPVHEGRHGQFVGYTWGYNRTLLAERVHDVLTAVAYARDLSGAGEVHLIGSGEAGPWVLLAAALAQDAVDRTVAVPSWSFADVTSLDDPRFLPGALRYGDLAGFARLVPEDRLLLGDAPLSGGPLLEWLTRTP